VELGWVVLGAEKAVWRFGSGLGIDWEHCGNTVGILRGWDEKNPPLLSAGEVGSVSRGLVLRC
jgi:hypothetical protein